MSEDENWQLYRNKVQQHIAMNTAFIPFLGMFLTQVRTCHMYMYMHVLAIDVCMYMSHVLVMNSVTMVTSICAGGAE